MQNILKTIQKQSQPIVFTLLVLAAAGFYVYTLGYSTNWAYIVSETRAAQFYRASQTANRMLSQVGFIGVVILLLVIFTGSFTRKTFYLSNIVLSILSAITLIVSSVLTLYYNSVLEPMYRNITTAEVPEHLYQIRRTVKSFFVFDFGNLYAILMILVSIVIIVFLVFKIKAQKERALLIKKAVSTYGN